MTFCQFRFWKVGEQKSKKAKRIETSPGLAAPKMAATSPPMAKKYVEIAKQFNLSTIVFGKGKKKVKLKTKGTKDPENHQIAFFQQKQLLVLWCRSRKPVTETKLIPWTHKPRNWRKMNLTHILQRILQSCVNPNFWTFFLLPETKQLSKSVKG